MKKRFTAILFILFFIPGLMAQEIGEEKETVEVINYMPEVFGSVKAKFETSLYDGKHRFNVRNSRFGVKGLAGQNMRYVIQIDFNNEGKVSILDSYIACVINNFEVSIGQQQYRFSSDLDRGPGNNIFANRSFLAKFLTTYYGSELENGVEKYFVKSIGSRDLGARIGYKLPNSPVALSFGVFNGSGTNNPEWDNKINLVGRVEIGREHGFKFVASHYNGHTPVNTKIAYPEGVPTVQEDFVQRIRMWGGELHYGQKNFRIEVEYAQRRLKNDGLQLMHTAHVLGYYQFWMKETGRLKYIMPVGRWDMGKDVEFLNKSKNIEAFDANRATLGLNLGFSNKLIGSEIRVQFEKYMLNNKTSDFARNPLLQDKITLEVAVTF